MLHTHSHSDDGTPSRQLVAPAICRPAAPLRWVVGLLLTFLLLLTGLAHTPTHSHVDLLSGSAVTAATSPSQEPCGSSDEVGHVHAMCGLSGSCSPSCSIGAPMDVAVAPARDQRTTAIASSDSLRGSTASAPPFHPPKLLLIA